MPCLQHTNSFIFPGQLGHVATLPCTHSTRANLSALTGWSPLKTKKYIHYIFIHIHVRIYCPVFSNTCRIHLLIPNEYNRTKYIAWVLCFIHTHTRRIWLSVSRGHNTEHAFHLAFDAYLCLPGRNWNVVLSSITVFRSSKK